MFRHVRAEGFEEGFAVAVSSRETDGVVEVTLRRNFAT